MSDELSRRQAQNGVNFDFQVKFDLEGQGQSPPKTIGILTKVFYIYGPNLVILAETDYELSCGQARDWRTDGHTRRQTDAGNDNTRRPILASGKKWTIWFQRYYEAISLYVITSTHWPFFRPGICKKRSPRDFALNYNKLFALNRISIATPIIINVDWNLNPTGRSRADRTLFTAGETDWVDTVRSNEGHTEDKRTKWEKHSTF